jgi:uncharacterized protein
MAMAIVHFEIQASNIERAKQFYETVFGWKIERYGDMDYWGIKTARAEYNPGDPVGIDGGLLPRKGGEPVNGAAVNCFVCTISVSDIDQTIEAIQNANGQIVVEKSQMDGVGWLASGKDTEGNIFGLIQALPQA